jgi:hypothetical protein
MTRLFVGKPVNIADITCDYRFTHIILTNFSLAPASGKGSIINKPVHNCSAHIGVSPCLIRQQKQTDLINPVSP